MLPYSRKIPRRLPRAMFSELYIAREMKKIFCQLHYLCKRFEKRRRKFYKYSLLLRCYTISPVFSRYMRARDYFLFGRARFPFPLAHTACTGKYLENKYPRERHLYKDPILSLIFPKGRLKNIVFILFCIFRKDSPCTILSLFSRKVPKDQFS